MEIRLATMADIDTLVALRRVFLKEFRAVDDAVWAAVEHNLRPWLAEHLGDDFLAMLGEEDGLAVCVAYLELRRRPPNDRCPSGVEGYLSNIYTHPGCRGRGHAGRLLRALLAEGRAAGAELFRLIASDAGRPLYEKLGFTLDDDAHMTLREAADG